MNICSLLQKIMKYIEFRYLRAIDLINSNTVYDKCANYLFILSLKRTKLYANIIYKTYHVYHCSFNNTCTNILKSMKNLIKLIEFKKMC